MKKLLVRSNVSQLILLVVVLFGAAQAWGQDAEKQASTNSAKGSTAPVATPNLSSSDLTPKMTEDYSTPALTATTKLDGIQTLDLERDDDDPFFTRQVTRVMWRAGDPIDLYVVKPAGVKKPPVILYLYGYPAENDRYLNREFCRSLTKQGFAAVGFVSALTGQRYHDRAMKEWFVSQLPESLASTAHDVQMILNYLGERGDLDLKRVGMYGEGSGATIAILAAAVDPRIKVLDLVSPWGDWAEWVAKSTRIPDRERPDYLKPEYLAQVAPLDPVKWLPSLKSQEVRLRNVRSLPETPMAAQEKIEAAASANVEILRYENTSTFATAVTSEGALTWIKGHLQPSGGSPYRAKKSAPASNSAGKNNESQR